MHLSKPIGHGENAARAYMEAQRSTTGGTRYGTILRGAA